jgi:uncharacterized protein (DUF736 family)
VTALAKVRGLYAPLRPAWRDHSIEIGEATMATEKEYDNTNRGALFKNNDKNGDKAPDYRGTLNASGLNWWVSAWIKTSAKGTKYMSLSLKLKDGEAATCKTVELNDEIPF